MLLFRLWPIELLLAHCFFFSYIPIEFGLTGNSAIPSVDAENPTLELNVEVDRMTRSGDIAIRNFLIERSAVMGTNYFFS